MIKTYQVHLYDASYSNYLLYDIDFNIYIYMLLIHIYVTYTTQIHVTNYFLPNIVIPISHFSLADNGTIIGKIFT